MLVIRHKNQTELISHFGYVSPTENNPYPLGAYDPEEWEQVELPELPQKVHPSTIAKTGDRGTEVARALSKVVNQQPVALRVQFAQARSTIAHLLAVNDLEAAQACLAQLPLETALKNKLLSQFD